MTSTELAWWNYQQAERRVSACKAAHDQTGQSIAESQRDRWFAEWLAAEMAANAAPRPASPTAESTPTN